MRNSITLILGLVAIAFTACVDDEKFVYAPEPVLPVALANYSEPSFSSSFWIDESRYEVTDAGATLGRVLFYDKIMSKNNKVSCASCHHQANAFAEPVAFSEGFKGELLSRHTPGITNVYDDEFLFWDGRSNSVHDLSLRPIRNHKEMGLDDTEFMIAKINKASYYEPLFNSAFGDSEVTEDRIADALSQFVACLISGNSKYDEIMAGNKAFSVIEQDGQNVFFGEGRCYQCHMGQDFNTRGGGFFGFPNGTIIDDFNGWSTSRANIGLDESYEDQGFGEFNGELEGEFKIPTLRNIAVTGPYMHDGRFSTLHEVVNHYNKNIANHPNLSEELQDWQVGGPARLGLDEYQVNALVAFLNTLTDEQFLRDPKFSDPFNK